MGTSAVTATPKVKRFDINYDQVLVQAQRPQLSKVYITALKLSTTQAFTNLGALSAIEGKIDYKPTKYGEYSGFNSIESFELDKSSIHHKVILDTKMGLCLAYNNRTYTFSPGSCTSDRAKFRTFQSQYPLLLPPYYPKVSTVQVQFLEQPLTDCIAWSNRALTPVLTKCNSTDSNWYAFTALV